MSPVAAHAAALPAAVTVIIEAPPSMPAVTTATRTGPRPSQARPALYVPDQAVKVPFRPAWRSAPSPWVER